MNLKRSVIMMICCLFLCSFTLPASAKTDIAFNEQWSRTLDYSLYTAMSTSTGDILTISYTADEEQLLFDFYKLHRDSGKIQKKLLLKSGYVFPFKSEDGQAYLMFYDTKLMSLVLYDENLEIVWSLEDENYLMYLEQAMFWDVIDGQFYFYDGVNLVPMLGFNLLGEELVFPAIVYERPTLTPCVGEDFCPELATVDVDIKDPVRNINQTVTLEPHFPKDHIVNFVSVFVYNWERYFDAISYDKVDFSQPDRYMMYINSVHKTDDTQMTHRFIEFNAQGQIVKEIEFGKDELYYDFFSTGNRFAFSYDDQYLLLNLDTMQLSTTTLDSDIAYSSDYEYPTYLMTDQSFYLFDEGYALGKQFARQHDERDLLTLLNDYVLLHSFNKSVSTVAYNPKTAQIVGHLKQAIHFLDVVETGNILAHGYNAKDYSYTLTMIHPSTLQAYEKNKTWTITFSQPVDPRSLNENTVYVVNAAGERVNGLTFSSEGKKVFVHAPDQGYTSGEMYTLVITDAIKSTNGRTVTSGKTITFTVK
ncbi:Ig-like domain-containing protein [Lysinibacillus sp. KU-BSD001]|uniref:Ig-like domain-containing protein n=1 Tax=Lysinibacillus sp. KU-BSD001 TaxID=3141328 RepID=UPI0036E38981